MPADKPLIRLTAEQLDRLTLLHRRKLQLTEKRLLHLGATPAELDQAVDGHTTTLANGGTIDIEGTDYHLVDHDETSVTLRRVH